MNHIRNGLLLAALVILYSTNANALFFLVNNTADVPDAFPGDGVCNPVNALPGTCTLRAAIMEANANPGDHHIGLPGGNYVLTNIGVNEDSGVTGDLDIHGSISIANDTPNPPSISGNFDDRVFDIHVTGQLTLHNVNVGAGMANVVGTTRGGAFQVRANANNAGRLSLKWLNVSSNIANLGGAIYSDGQVFIEDSEFFFNVITDDQVQPEFTDGTAILSRGLLVITRSTFRSNGVIPGGEGQFLPAEYAVHSKVGFSGALLTQITNSTFYNNTNGIFSDGVPTVLLFSTLVDNNQRGLRFLRNLDTLGQVQLAVDNTVIVGHTADCNQIPSGEPEFDIAFNVNASSDESCGFTGFNSFQNIAFPFVGGPDNNGGPTTTFLPRGDSVLVDPVGSTCHGISSDQRGAERLQDGDDVSGALCDIGAVEISAAEADAIFSDGFE